MLTRKGNPVRPLRLCWPHAGRAHTFGIAPKVCKNSRPLQCNSIGRCTMIVIEPEPEQKGCFSYKDSEKRTPFCSFAVDRPGFYCAMFERHRHHHPILKILKILILTRKRNPVRPLRLCWPHAGRAHTFGIAPKVCKNSRPLQCNSIGRCTMLIIEPEPEQKGCFSYKDSEKRTPFCSFAVDRPGFYCAMFERHRHHHPILKILKILILTRKRDAVRPLRLCWPHAGLFEWKVKSEKWKVKSEKWDVSGE